MAAFISMPLTTRRDVVAFFAGPDSGAVHL
jgi:hypothetical protein